jgi:hypothetical protein
MPGYSDQYDRGTIDVYIEHNTVINNVTNGKFLKVSGALSGVTVINNVYVAPHLTIGDHNATPISINNKDLSGFKLIANNIWPDAIETDDGGINYVGGDYKTPAQWEAYQVVQHDQYKDVALGSTYSITLGGVSAGATMKKAA